MEDGKIKSALEIAMEKVAKMADLTPKEIREQKDREYRPRGEVTASKYLSHVIKNTDLAVELSKYQGEEGEVVLQQSAPPVLTTWTGSGWDGACTWRDAPYSVELSVGGKYVYGHDARRSIGRWRWKSCSARVTRTPKR